MEKQQLLDLLADPKKLAEVFSELGTMYNEEQAKYYYPEKQDVFDPQKRLDKVVQKPTGMLGPKGEVLTQESSVPVVRVAFPLQKLIVARATTFVAGSPVELMATPETDVEKLLLKMVRKAWVDNKLDYKNLPIAETMMSEKEVLELWYFENVKAGYWQTLAPAAQKRLRMVVVKPSDGNKLYPVFNSMRDLVGLGRIYKVGTGESAVEYMDVYTDEKYWFFQKQEDNWIERKQEAVLAENTLGKMMLVYYSQPRYEWQDVESIVARLNELLSNHGDINDYNGSPAIVAEGKILGFSAKGERGKAFEVEKGGKLSYLSWDHAPESIKMEIENLLNACYTFTQTPNISFEAVKGIGVQSGVSIKLLFMDAHSKARRKQYSNYGESLQRRINVLKAACIKIHPPLADAAELSIYPEFRDYMPTNELEAAQVENYKVNTLLNANGRKALVGHETSVVGINPLDIEDKAGEFAKVKKELQEQALTEQNNSGFGSE